MLVLLRKAVGLLSIVKARYKTAWQQQAMARWQDTVITQTLSFGDFVHCQVPPPINDFCPLKLKRKNNRNNSLLFKASAYCFLPPPPWSFFSSRKSGLQLPVILYHMISSPSLIFVLYTENAKFSDCMPFIKIGSTAFCSQYKVNSGSWYILFFIIHLVHTRKKSKLFTIREKCLQD